MARRLNTFVYVEGVAYGPDSEVPDEVAERITAPGVWADEAPATEGVKAPEDEGEKKPEKSPARRPVGKG